MAAAARPKKLGQKCIRPKCPVAIGGQAPKGPRKDQVRKNIRLCTIVSSYEERRENIMDYLKGCTDNFDF